MYSDTDVKQNAFAQKLKKPLSQKLQTSQQNSPLVVLLISFVSYQFSKPRVYG
jgi:hypothetical protein